MASPDTEPRIFFVLDCGEAVWLYSTWSGLGELAVGLQKRASDNRNDAWSF